MHCNNNYAVARLPLVEGSFMLIYKNQKAAN